MLLVPMFWYTILLNPQTLVLRPSSPHMLGPYAAGPHALKLHPSDPMSWYLILLIPMLLYLTLLVLMTWYSILLPSVFSGPILLALMSWPVNLLVYVLEPHPTGPLVLGLHLAGSLFYSFLFKSQTTPFQNENFTPCCLLLIQSVS